VLGGSLALMAITACGSQHLARSHSTACFAGESCVLVGKLALFPGEPAGAAIVSGNGWCAKLALPDEFYYESLRDRWNNRIVEVRGLGFSQPDPNTDLGYLSWFSEKDRRLATGMCDSGPGVYVLTMRSGDGRSWPPL